MQTNSVMESNSNVSLRQLLATARNYERLTGLPDTFKMKDTDLEKKHLHTLRMGDCIKKADFQMGKENRWTIPDEIEQALERLDGEAVKCFDGMDKESQRIALANAESFAEDMPDSTDEVFLSKEVGLRGRSPGGLNRHGFITPDERRSGYATKWRMTERGVALKRLTEIADE